MKNYKYYFVSYHMKTDEGNFGQGFGNSVHRIEGVLKVEELRDVIQESIERVAPFKVKGIVILNLQEVDKEFFDNNKNEKARIN